MEKYRNMEVRGTLPQVGYWELAGIDLFNQFEFQKSEIGKYVKIVVVYNLELGFIDIYFFGQQEIPSSVNGIELSPLNGYKFEHGIIFWSKEKNHSREDARNVFRMLYRNSTPEPEEKE